ncbi:MAG TPA: flippase [Thermomicrobiaceae bacterium]|nr:flippase [Thermomicrobiaceae bacterium]
MHWRFASTFFAAGAVAAAICLFALAYVGIPGLDRLKVNSIQRIAKNSAAPIAGQLMNRAVDLAFAIISLRLLGATENGEYAVAVTAWLYISTIAGFGLGLLITREAAREPERAGRLLGSSTLLRILILLLLVPIASLYAIGGHLYLNLARDSAIAVGLLTISVLPSVYADGVSAIFNSREQMELPAALNVVTNLTRAGFGLAALAAGYGVVGLAGVSILSTTISMFAYHVSLRHLHLRPEWGLSRRELRWLIDLSWPLLLNSLLLNVFFRADYFFIQPIKGNHATGVYDAAYKFINMLLIIPSYFTMAIFPLMSRYATTSQEKLLYGYRLAIKFMLVLAWPIVIGTMAVAPILIEILGGHAYLPDSAHCLRILIWFLPMSYVNGVTQYVLVAVDRQRSITLAFIVGVIFNLGANAVAVPLYGVTGASVITVLTEVSLFIPLQLTAVRAIGPVHWGSTAARAAIAGLLMGAVVFASWRLGPIPAAALGVIAYGLALVLTRAIGRREYHLALALVGRSAEALPETP